MPRFSDTSLQASKPAIARKDRIKDPKNTRRTIDPAILEMFDVAKEKGMITTFDIWSAGLSIWLHRHLLPHLLPGPLPHPRRGGPGQHGTMRGQGLYYSFS